MHQAIIRTYRIVHHVQFRVLRTDVVRVKPLLNVALEPVNGYRPNCDVIAASRVVPYRQR